jgi:hypothetical protein
MKDEMKVRVVRKDEKSTIPVNHGGFQWVSIVAEQNGIVLTIGPGKGFGVFINEEKLIEIFEQFINETELTIEIIER